MDAEAHTGNEKLEREGLKMSEHDCYQEIYGLELTRAMLLGRKLKEER